MPEARCRVAHGCDSGAAVTPVSGPAVTLCLCGVLAIFDSSVEGSDAGRVIRESRYDLTCLFVTTTVFCQPGSSAPTLNPTHWSHTNINPVRIGATGRVVCLFVGFQQVIVANGARACGVSSIECQAWYRDRIRPSLQAELMANSVKPVSYVSMGFVAGICASILAQHLSVDQVRSGCLITP